LYFDVDPKASDDHAIRRSLYTALPWDITHVVLFTAAAITGSGIAMSCAIAGDAASYNDDNRARWYVELPVNAWLHVMQHAHPTPPSLLA